MYEKIRINGLYQESEKQWGTTGQKHLYGFMYELHENKSINKGDMISFFANNNEEVINGEITQVIDNEFQFYVY